MPCTLIIQRTETPGSISVGKRRGDVVRVKRNTDEIARRILESPHWSVIYVPDLDAAEMLEKLHVDRDEEIDWSTGERIDPRRKWNIDLGALPAKVRDKLDGRGGLAAPDGRGVIMARSEIEGMTRHRDGGTLKTRLGIGVRDGRG